MLSESFNFCFYVRPSIHCLYFIYGRKINVRAHVQITRQWKSTLTQQTLPCYYRAKLHVHDDLLSYIYK